MHLIDVNGLDPGRTYWALAVVAPCRDWAAVPGCRRGARYLIKDEPFGASRDTFATFDSQLKCLHWIMNHRAALNQAFPGTNVRPVELDRWLLGLD